MPRRHKTHKDDYMKNFGSTKKSSESRSDFENTSTANSADKPDVDFYRPPDERFINLVFYGILTP